MDIKRIRCACPKYMSDKCCMVTISTTSQIPMQPIFSPIYNTTKPYRQSRANTQRPLMYPDELLRLDNAQGIILFRGHQPLQLYKIIPDELPGFDKLKTVRVTDYIPAWRAIGAGHTEQRTTAVRSESSDSVEFAIQIDDQPSLFDAANEDARFGTEPPAGQQAAPSNQNGIMQRYTYSQITGEEIKQDAERG